LLSRAVEEVLEDLRAGRRRRGALSGPSAAHARRPARA